MEGRSSLKPLLRIGPLSLALAFACSSGGAKTGSNSSGTGGGPNSSAAGTHAASGGAASAGKGATAGSSSSSAGRGGSTAGSGGQGTSTAGSGSGGSGSGAGGKSASGGGGGKGAGTGGTASPGTSTAAEVAKKLGRDHFLIGMGNDLDNDHTKDGAYTLGVTLDTHDVYMVGVMGQGGWPDWNSGGTFVDAVGKPAKDNGVVPMYTLYAMVKANNEGNPGLLLDDSWMKPYWDGAKLLYQRIQTLDVPAIVHLEPDWWAFAQQQSKGDPASLPAHVSSLAPDCSDQPDNLIGMGKCLVALGRKYAPKAVLGFHASRWADSDPAKIASFLVQIGAGDADIVVIDMLDRDAGCFEAHGDGCTRNDGPWYWDESNATSPNFHEHLAAAKTIGEGMKKPILWWQVPFGVPSTTPGGTPSHYRDNRVHYIFNHIDEFVAAGGLGVSFGVGSGGQTYITTDGDQFKKAVTSYFAAPTHLP